ncbi:hypothetical protein PsorP6_010913 [Peronosclerospora sorghi]|uniref:Uncharacterized protein n=1 Tax=Peronosclerospora sorghi TaxID=230839 RepID=A0ACC0VWB3_9STRA|nr:hypothetical protein PsorP6_010913 [Peronosclerospora sorghi]
MSKAKEPNNEALGYDEDEEPYSVVSFAHAFEDFPQSTTLIALMQLRAASRNFPGLKIKPGAFLNFPSKCGR